jgi:hypothetical protein
MSGVHRKAMHSHKAKAEFELGQNSKSQQQNIEINLKSLGLVEVIGARLGDPSAGRMPCMLIMYNNTPRSYIPLKSLRDDGYSSNTTKEIKNKLINLSSRTTQTTYSIFRRLRPMMHPSG